MAEAQSRIRTTPWIMIAMAAMVLMMPLAAWSWGGAGWMPGPGMMTAGWLWMLLPLALMGAVMYVMMTMGHGHDAHAQEPRDAQAVLDRRYAAGEVSREDYLRMKGDLDAQRRP